MIIQGGEIVESPRVFFELTSAVVLQTLIHAPALITLVITSLLRHSPLIASHNDSKCEYKMCFIPLRKKWICSLH